MRELIYFSRKTIYFWIFILTPPPFPQNFNEVMSNEIARPCKNPIFFSEKKHPNLEKIKIKHSGEKSFKSLKRNVKNIKLQSSFPFFQ